MGFFDHLPPTHALLPDQVFWLLRWLNIYHCFPQDMIWHKVFFIVGVLGKGEVGHESWLIPCWNMLVWNQHYFRRDFNECNVSQMTLLGLGLPKCNVSLICMPAHSLNLTWTRPLRWQMESDEFSNFSLIALFILECRYKVYFITFSLKDKILNFVNLYLFWIFS